MKKLLIGTLAVATLVLTTTVASAGQRHEHGHWRGHHHGHHHGHRRPNYAPYIAGAIALGVLGAITYDQYGRRCHREIVGYDMYGEPITRRICD